MTHKKVLTVFFIGLVVFAAMIPGYKVHGQAALFIELAFPQLAFPGDVVNLLLRGAGFESVDELNGVVISGIEVPILDFEILSDDSAELQLFIPEDMPLGDTEITFIFDNFGYDAFFQILEAEERPFISQLSPEKGQVERDLILSFVVNNFFLGELGGITINGHEIPVIEFEVNESGEVWNILIFIPPEVQSGETEIKLYFENFSFSHPFFVSGPEFDEQLTPAVYGYDPNEVWIDSEVEVDLQGHFLFEVGDLIGITIGGIDIPILSYRIRSDELASARVFVPPEIPIGETRIFFYFDNETTYSDSILVHPPDDENGFLQPQLWSISPQDGDPDSNVQLQIEGENLRLLDGLGNIRIGNLEIREYDYSIESNELVIVYFYLPEDAPLGGHSVSIQFENAEINEYFYVNEPLDYEFPIWPAVIIGIGGAGVLAGGGLLVKRVIDRGKTSRKDPEDHPQENQPVIDFEVTLDSGNQTIEHDRESLTAELEIRFILSIDPGTQNIEPPSSELIDKGDLVN